MRPVPTEYYRGRVAGFSGNPITRRRGRMFDVRCGTARSTVHAPRYATPGGRRGPAMTHQEHDVQWRFPSLRAARRARCAAS
jgi:hypothetical protein